MKGHRCDDSDTAEEEDYEIAAWEMLADKEETRPPRKEGKI